MAKTAKNDRTRQKIKPGAKSTSTPVGRGKRSMAQGADRYALYRLSVQAPDHEVEMFEQFFKDAYGRGATVLREDFCAAFAVCCEWVKGHPERSALGVDLDPEPLAYGSKHYLPALSPTEQGRIQLLEENVLTCRAKADIIAAQNYSWFIFKTRPELLKYFTAVLNKEGVFVLDMLGGSAMHDDEVEESRAVARPTLEDKRNNPPFRYVWEQETFNPITHDCRFHIHFRFPDGSSLERAFTYDWRLWTLPEARELLAEAGFSQVKVYWETEDKHGEPSGNYKPTLKAKPDATWLCYLVAVK
jgi:hypothetical protein